MKTTFNKQTRKSLISFPPPFTVPGFLHFERFKGFDGLGVWRVWRVWSVWSLLRVSGLANGKLGRPEEAMDVALEEAMDLAVGSLDAWWLKVAKVWTF